MGSTIMRLGLTSFGLGPASFWLGSHNLWLGSDCSGLGSIHIALSFDRVWGGFRFGAGSGRIRAGVERIRVVTARLETQLRGGAGDETRSKIWWRRSRVVVRGNAGPRLFLPWRSRLGPSLASASRIPGWRSAFRQQLSGTTSPPLLCCPGIFLFEHLLTESWHLTAVESKVASARYKRRRPGRHGWRGELV